MAGWRRVAGALSDGLLDTWHLRRTQYEHTTIFRLTEKRMRVTAMANIKMPPGTGGALELLDRKVSQGQKKQQDKLQTHSTSSLNWTTPAATKPTASTTQRTRVVVQGRDPNEGPQKKRRQVLHLLLVRVDQHPKPSNPAHGGRRCRKELCSWVT